jgi:hypothetical protein
MTKATKTKPRSTVAEKATAMKGAKAVKASPKRRKMAKAITSQDEFLVATPPTEINITDHAGEFPDEPAGTTFTISGTTAAIPAAAALLFRIYDMASRSFQTVSPQNYVPDTNWSATFTVDPSADGASGEVVEFRVKALYQPGNPQFVATASTGVFVQIP